uniref:Uncharacterized protein n=1 Tax=Rhizophora mucronata TaxID=61149 RepID=A0A2P2QPF4_RHIMU
MGKLGYLDTSRHTKPSAKRN